jgi:PAS domain S-box-containing protein
MASPREAKTTASQRKSVTKNATSITASPLAVVRALARDAPARAAACGRPLASLKTLIEALPLAVFVADDHGHYVLANAAASRMTGFSTRELCRLWVWDLTPGANERDFEVLWRAFLQQKEQRGIYQVVVKSGTVVKAVYAARAHVLPHLHVSVLRFGERRSRKRTAPSARG